MLRIRQLHVHSGPLAAAQVCTEAYHIASLHVCVNLKHLVPWQIDSYFVDT